MRPLNSLLSRLGWTGEYSRFQDADPDGFQLQKHEGNNIESRTTPTLPAQILPFLTPLLPGFLQRSGQRARKIHPTSYLDGLRGVAALIVVIHHYAYEFTSISPQGWHTGEAGSHDYLFLMPVLRVIHSGRFMVIMFFAISGYVLSFRGLQLAREGKQVQLLESLSSSVFRRWLRLHLPVVVSTFVAFLLARGGFWINLTPDWNHSGGSREQRWYPYPEGSFMHNLKDWYLDTLMLIDPFRYGAFAVSRYNINILWTIPNEWMGSMVVFATVLGIARCKTWAKLSVLSILIYWCHFNARWEPATFLTGLLLAELSFQRPKYMKKAIFSDRAATRIFWGLLFFFGIYAGSHPQKGPETTPGYQALMSYVPSWYNKDKEVFWPAISGGIVIFALEHAKFLQDMFTTRFAQYLGDISFALYMLHFQIMCTMGHWLVPKCMNVTGGWSNGEFGFATGMAMAMFVLMPVTFWASDVYARLIDVKSVKFARWISEKMFVG